MGNLIMLAIRAQVKAIGQVNLEPHHVKRCDSCSARQYTNLKNCRVCGGTCQIIDGSSGGAAAAAIPIVEMEDPATGELGRYVTGADGRLIRIGPSAETVRRMVRHNRRKKKEVENDEDTDVVIDQAKAFELDHALIKITRLADLVDPKREKISEEKVPYGSSPTIENVEVMTRKQMIEDALHEASRSVQCAVCLSEYDSPITLPCGHSLCSCCVSDIGTKCPICRVEYSKSLWKKIKSEPHMNEVINDYVEIVRILGDVARNELSI
mmetsp:Transcript_38283/g.55930  ORF Transcript_38283/g.55930 Transcript_38283/m.55930 type:complete len:267 (+) Transcript_38283:18-818(+)